MPPLAAKLAYVIGTLGLFYLDRHEKTRTSLALWLPAAWLFLVCSRATSTWLGVEPTKDSVEVYLEGSPIDQFVFTTLLVAGLVVVIARMDRAGPLLGRNALIVVFFGYCALSIFWSDFPLAAYKKWSKSLGDLVMVLIILTESHPIRALTRLLTRLGFVLFPLSVFLLIYFPHVGYIMAQSHTLEPCGVTTQKNQLGVICLMYGLVFLWNFRAAYRNREDASRGRRMLAYGSIILMIVWLLRMCKSMTSITGLAMAAGVMLLVGWRTLIPRRAVVHLAVLAVVGLSLFALFLDPGGGLLRQLGKDPTLHGRTEIWSLVLDKAVNPWVGTGFESFWLGDRIVELRDALPNFPINQAHNGYIEVYLNLGWVGVSLIGLLLLTTYRKITRMFLEDPDSASLLLALFLATVFQSFTEAAFRMMYAPWVFFLLVIMAASQNVPLENSPRAGPAQAGEIATNKKPEYATQGVSPFSD